MIWPPYMFIFTIIKYKCAILNKNIKTSKFQNLEIPRF
ncbi:hypothetical protein SAST39_03304 [Staphylococcus aureus]|nr:hypothetical protein AZ30_07945 [Staphylococcus aureus USA300-ISMMS1]ALY27302.1 hypothetical protein SAGV51_03675 [Staphylococcus aureus]ETO50686.1 hypothetical protein Y001_13850 [Staphylococcus aureus MUF256]ETO52731.1 hypothetical protein Y003_14105 [Staphylococcus aureus MUM475]ETO57037.1 hypothetical protein Y002_02090 [Staphylococcus aureus MUM270]EUN39671.1 hypothetical protein AS94_01155 [Staphylococcus aureus subsp. aureus 300-169]EWC66533.1 hypothetical protein W893_04870 [Staphy